MEILKRHALAFGSWMESQWLWKMFWSMTPKDRVLLIVPLLAIFVLASFLHILLLSIRHMMDALKFDSRSMECDWNGDFLFQLQPQQYSLWKWPSPLATKYVLAITWGWGNMEFATAKAIDVAWDWAVGRSWQAVVAWSIYATYRRYWAISHTALRHPLAVNAVIALQYYTTSLSGLWTYTLGLARRRGKKSTSRIATTILVLDVIYTLLVPTWISAMSGYAVKSEPMLRLDDGSFVGMASLKLCEMIIIDGARVGLTNNTCLDYGDEMSAFQYCTKGATKHCS